MHSECRRHLLKVGESHIEFNTEYGISKTEGGSLLGEKMNPQWETRRSCLEWCTEHNKTSSTLKHVHLMPDFDKRLSVDGDSHSQGVEYLFSALSAHMWPGMILKSGDKITEPSLPENEAETVGRHKYKMLSSHFDFEDLEQLMSERGNIQDNLRSMPDFQRREMAAKLALKMTFHVSGKIPII